MTDTVAESAKRDRIERLFDLQRAVSLERNERWIGRNVLVLVDDAADEQPAATATGRTEHQALEIDGTVHVGPAGDARPGDFIDVRITDAQDYDLIGERVAADE
jgi:ribosomal protein S12 methylthiotransferase